MGKWLQKSWYLGLVLAVPGFAADASADSGLALWEELAWGECDDSRTIEPIVTTDWLANNVGLEDVVVLDIRPTDAYDEGHIPTAINEPLVVPFSAWITMVDDLLLEVPAEAELEASIGALGITLDSSVVIVSDPNPGEPPTYGLANATRVADTLIYAGVRNVAILDGGYSQWVADGRLESTDVPVVEPTAFVGEFDGDMFVSKEYVEERIGRAVIIDARDPDVYFGVTVEPFAPEAGHIPSARSLPTPWIWQDGLYRDTAELEAMARGVAGWFKHREVIVYCGVGGYASAWWYVLTQVAGYRNVKIYDGSAQEWVRDNAMVPYHWY